MTEQFRGPAWPVEGVRVGCDRARSRRGSRRCPRGCRELRLRSAERGRGEFESKRRTEVGAGRRSSSSPDGNRPSADVAGIEALAPALPARSIPSMVASKWSRRLREGLTGAPKPCLTTHW